MGRTVPAIRDPILGAMPNQLLGTDANSRLVSASSTLFGSYRAQNKDVSQFAAGCPVATHSSGSGIVAASAANSSLPSVGIAAESIATGVTGAMVEGGILTLADWSAIVGTTTLAAKTTYFLSTTPGLLTPTPPTTSGQLLQRVGVSIAPDTLEIAIDDPILL